MPISPDQTGEPAPDGPMVTEIIFEVTVRHYVFEDTPSPTEEDIHAAVERHLQSNFDLEAVTVRRI